MYPYCKYNVTLELVEQHTRNTKGGGLKNLVTGYEVVTWLKTHENK